MKKQKGISLIVLIITVIVIIILATAVIVTIATNNPITEANKARYESDRDNMQAVFTNTVAKVMTQNRGNVKVTAGQINNQTSGVDKATGQVNYTVENATDSSNTNGVIVFDKGTNEATKYYTGTKLPIYKAGETKWYVDEDGVISLEVNGVKYGEGSTTGGVTPPVEQGLKPGQIATADNNKFTDNEGNIATIPIDFIVVPGCETISKGLVISDNANDTEVNKPEDGSGIVANGNQFVWIPVNDMSTFVREEGYNSSGKLQNFLTNCSEPLNYDGVEANKEEKEIYNNMIASVEKYNGFYMGRYEASNDGNGNAQSKKNKEPWGGLSWSSSEDVSVLTGGAVEKARGMYLESVATTGKAVSNLPFGVEWDETIRFVKKNYPGIEKDSKEYGNYKIGNAIPTGSNEKYALNNIYDMAGNVTEWTMEAYYTYRIFRGGDYAWDHPMDPISSRGVNYDFGNEAFENMGFRVALYISL